MPYPKGEVVRPAALTPECQKLIVGYLAEGNYLETACRASGITSATFRHWRQRAEQGDPDAQQYADFFAVCKTAMAVGEVNALREVKSGRQGWQGSAWYLERRYPGRWGKKDKLELDMRKTDDMSQKTDEELASIARGQGGG